MLIKITPLNLLTYCLFFHILLAFVKLKLDMLIRDFRRGKHYLTNLFIVVDKVARVADYVSIINGRAPHHGSQIVESILKIGNLSR